MPTTLAQRRAELIDRIIEAGAPRLAVDPDGVTERFVRAFYAHVPPDDVALEAPVDLFGAALAALKLANTRKDPAPRVRAYAPSLEDHGWASNRTIVEIVTDDMPFLVDSIRGALNARDLAVHLTIHPIMRLKRSADGLIVDLKPLGAQQADDDGFTTESLMQLRATDVGDLQALDAVAADLRDVLEDVGAAVADWREMRVACRAAAADIRATPGAAPEDAEEFAAFLEWLDDDNFAFLGCRDYVVERQGRALTIVEDSGLGVLRDQDLRVFAGLRDFHALPPDVQAFVLRPDRLLATKANLVATVHRRVPMDAIIVKHLGEDGSVAGLRVLAGLFTSDAYSRRPKEIPILRRKVDAILDRSGLVARSHDGRRLLHILETHPRDELFQADVDSLYETAMGILHLQDRQRAAVFARRDPFERFVSCLVYIPRDNYDTPLRRKIQKALEAAYDGETQAYYTHLTDDVLARLHVVIRTTPGAVPDAALSVLEARIAEAARNWDDALAAALTQARGESEGALLGRRYARAFSPGYRDAFTGREAVADVDEAETLLRGGKPRAVHLYKPLDSEPRTLAVKIMAPDAPAPISDLLPMLENMGLRVVAERPYEIAPADSDGRTVWLHDYLCEAVAAQGEVDAPRIRAAFEDALDRVMAGAIEDDGFNRLTLAIGMSARNVTILRAYAKYLKQAALPFSQDYVEDALLRHPHLAADLVRLFDGLFDPAKVDTPAASDARAGIEIALAEVESLDDDRILRRFVNVIEATQRTNAFQRVDDAPKPRLALKIASQMVDELPAPRPYAEIFVYAPQVEGVHLRFGKVARGGLRWSDRREDFRTEILGLVKAQQVKNAVIVPVGSKGGFFVKRPPPTSAGREAAVKEGIASYTQFISGLLDVTDTRQGDAVIPPKDVVRRDGDDPYLVVAADKGTATFSDIANGVAEDYGFWLGDAFASGGSAGYDHKKMGITARGAWESVKRHFREMGRDCQTEAFTCVGVGDMSGDVFGNGMLLSRKTKLVGAFNHLHIFVDPDPDPEVSWTERQRMFDLPRSAWTDYDAALISKGGGVFDRKAKAIPVSPEMAALFGIDGPNIQPSALIQAMLKAEVDLLWFGGIGTYIKAAEESHADAGDRANDALRVDGDQVRAQVIGEGANLGATQLGRIAYAARGGRINTDAVDNSAGVDCSDHEVNIKILLGMVEQSGDMTRKQRDILLAEMTDEVAELVLRDNYRQTLAITMMETQSTPLLDQHARFIRRLEKSGRLDRRLEFLPDEEEIADRRGARRGLLRPELSVLLAYAKLELYDTLLDSDIPDDPLLLGDLKRYFPEPLQARFPGQIEQHRLRREIIATYVVNSMVNRVGASFVSEAQELTGLAAADVARAYAVVRDAFGLRELWTAIDALDYTAPARLQLEMLREIQRLIDRVVMWLLRNEPQPMDISKVNAAYGPGVQALRTKIRDLISAENRAVVDARVKGFESLGAPADLAWTVGSLTQLSPAMDVVTIAKAVDAEPTAAGAVYFELGEALSFDWLRRAAMGLARDNHWVEMATQAIVEDLVACQTAMTKRVFLESNGAEGSAAVAAWLDAHAQKVGHARDVLAEMRAIGQADLAMLAVAARELKTTAEG